MRCFVTYLFSFERLCGFCHSRVDGLYHVMGVPVPGRPWTPGINPALDSVC